MKNINILISLFVLGTFLYGSTPINKNLETIVKEGDIVMFSNNTSSISIMVKDFCQSNFSSMGIIKIEDNIIKVLKMDSDSFRDKGSLRIYSLYDYINFEKTNEIKIIRVKNYNKEHITQINQFYKEVLNNKNKFTYDYNYLLSTKNKLYCTEFIYTVYSHIFDTSMNHSGLNILCDTNIKNIEVEEVYQWKK